MKSRLAGLAAMLFVGVEAGGATVPTTFPGLSSPTTMPVHEIAAGPFKPTWESLASQYQCPDWFRDAKFGIWAHWTAQCVPEQGDWYARHMYEEGLKDYTQHIAEYGHPTTVGFMEMDNLWKADHWEPDKLMALYKAAGAKYFFALANHHDNFDCYDSTFHDWNSVKVGPHKDIVGTWEKAARAAGLRFGLSNHSSHAWHWFQVAYGYDVDGPFAGQRYDAATLTKADGKGKWWEGLDPQDLYVGRTSLAAPDGIKTIEEMKKWTGDHSGKWFEHVYAENEKFAENWYERCKDLIDKYHPDQLYFDDTGIPLDQYGLDVVAHYYNSNLAEHGGKLEAVVNGKQLPEDHRPALVEDYERGAANKIMPNPWQTDTCIGQWHYNRALLEKHQYKSVGTVVKTLVDVVSKNGNLMLSVPIRGDGTIDADEEAFLHGMADWMKVNGEGIFASRPWKVFGEGASNTTGGMFNEGKQKYTADDLRFTTKDGKLYVFVLGEPMKDTVVRALATGAPTADRVSAVRLLGADAAVHWTQTADGLVLPKPDSMPAKDVIGYEVTFAAK